MSKDWAWLVLRMAGLGLAPHGWAKVVMLSTGGGARVVEVVAALGFPQPLLFAWAAALAELLGGLLVAAGLLTRPAAALAAFTMAVAAFGQHRAHDHLLVKLGWLARPADVVKSWGNPELALVYLAAFLAVAIAGPGRFALDSLRGRGRQRGHGR